jgi:hypothetical protein
MLRTDFFRGIQAANRSWKIGSAMDAATLRHLIFE